ncbi:MAG: sugar phosphate isomerase/epimerase [Clostridia bacterium]|nr:sugar phosphate isomerase/epimerase [Clostridia bacterium]
MKLGYTTINDRSSYEMGGRIGYECVEINGMDLLNMSDDDIKGVVEMVNENNMTIGSIGCSVSHLDADPQKKEEANRYVMRAIEKAHLFGTDIVMTNAYTDLTDTISGNIVKYKEVFSEYARAAEANGVRIVIENCPHMVREPIRFGNLAFSPEMWDVMFNEVPSEAIGLEFDPSHLVWQGIDIPRAIKMFKSRIYAVHAKDTEINHDNLGLVGYVAGKVTKSKFGGRFWNHRIPGLGDIDWKEFFRALYSIGYNGPVFLEQEDNVFTGDRAEQGYIFGYNFLKDYMLDICKK